MGIQGLSSLVENEPGLFFKTVKLHDSFLVIDGNCISCWLYRLSCHKSVLNGDYNEYERCVKNFFSVLKRCHIFPVVILDGGHEVRKRKRIQERMVQRIDQNGGIKSVDFKGETGTPALLTEVFKDCMTDMQILFCQSILEADLDVTKTAQFLNCPVLSFDSDFYLDVVDYIPFSTLSLHVLALKKDKEASGSRYFIYGKLFDRTSFLSKFGDLSDKSFLPLLSFLLGNDYAETKIYEAFFSTLNAPRNQLKLQQKIFVLCKWMKNFNSPAIAVNNFLEQIPLHSRRKTKEELLRCLDEKNNDLPSYLVQYLQHSLTTGRLVLPSIGVCTNVKIIEGSSKWIRKAVAYVSPDEDNRTTLHTAAKIPIPEWVLAQHVQGKFPRNLMDLLHSQNVFLSVQMEEHSLPSVSPRMLQILERILGIIYHDRPVKKNFQITLFLRKSNQLGKKFLTPTPISCNQSFTFAEIPMLSLPARKSIAFNVLNIEEMQDQTVLPDDWLMFFLTLADWYRADNSQIMTCALGCLIFSSIFVGIIDKKLGYFEEESAFLGKYSKELDKVSYERYLQAGNLKCLKTMENFSTLNLISDISNVDFEDCLLALKQFMPFRSSSYSKDFYSQTLYRPVLHCFAQFQNNVMINEILNSVLDFPFRSLRIADFYCGTLAYNIFFEIKSHKNLLSFIETKFHHTPTLKRLFLSAIQQIEKLSKCTIFAESSPRRKNNNRNRRRKQHTALCEQINFSQVLKDIKIPKV